MPFVPNVPGVPALTSYLTTPLPLLAVDTLLTLAEGSQSVWGIYDQFGVPIIASALAPLFNLNSVSSLNALSSLLTGQQLVNQFSVVDFEYKQDWNISNYPVESGGFQSYNKVQMPFDIRMRIAAGGNQANRTSLLTIVDNLANSGLTAGQPGLQSIFSSLSPFAIGSTVSPVISTASNILSAPNLLSGIASSILGTSTAIPLYNVLTPEKIYTNCSVSHYDYKRTSVNGVGILVVDVWLLEVRVTATSSFTNTQQPTDTGQQTLGNVQPSTSTPASVPFQ